ncbi:MAG: DNA polymerase I [Dehalococcoidia bacterium]|nr:DNA polymerase I [Dehalococcoidia bacterium]
MSAPTSPRLVLIDGHSIIHRSFHAMKQLKEPLKVASTGELIGAAFGFANTFLAMFGELKPTHVIVALDMAGPTFRHEITETYKATRVPMAEEEREEFGRQLRRCRQVIETFGIPMRELAGFEADDILGTLCARAAEKGMETYLVSMDSDIAQLVRPGVHLWMYRPYQRDSVLYTTGEDVQERYGVRPEQMPDLKALKGDVSDNIPGIPGVGDKTAIKLLQEFGSVESLIERVDEVQPAKLQALVREYEGQTRQSKRLATIDCDAPVALDVEEANFYAHYDQARVSELFRELEFRTLVPRLPQQPGVPAAAPAPTRAAQAEQRYSIVRTEAELEALANRIAGQKWFVLDTETTSRESMRAAIVGVSVGLGGGEAYYVPVGHAPRLGDDGQLPPGAVLARLGPLIEDDAVAITGHNLKFDIVVLANQGVWARGVQCDTMIAAYLLGEGGSAGRPEEGNLALPWLVARRLGLEIPERSQLLGQGNRKSAQLTMDQVDIEATAACACAGVDASARLWQALEPELAEKGMQRLFSEIEMPLVTVLARMELNGVAIDTGALHEMSESLTMEIRRVEEEIYASVGHDFNIGSPIQLSGILFEELRLPRTRRLKTGAYSTDQQALEGLRGLHPIVDYIYEYRELTKLKSTYLDTLPFLVNPRTNRLHTDFNQTGAATGRLSSSNPNVQNIPVRTALGEQIRRAFIARDAGADPHLLSADYSQIELRIMAHITGDEALVEAFRRDEDIHAATASQVFGVPLEGVTPDMRRRAKVFNFGVLYGLSEYGLSVREKIPREDAATFIRTYFEKYPGIKRYVEETVTKVRSYGYAETLFGRRRYIPEINSTNFNVRAAAERAAINMPVQGTAADIIKIAMNRLDAEMQRRRLRSLMTLQVHDELIFECPQDELEEMRRLCLEIMPQSLEMEVPLKIDTKVGRSWGEMQYGEPVDVGEFPA